MTTLVSYFAFIIRLVLADKRDMRALYLTLFFSTVQVFAATGVKGVVTSPQGCSSPAMVWVSLDKEVYKERLLLMHTEVPVGGSFQFYLKPGNYQLRASDKAGCEYFERVKVSEAVGEFKVKLVKK